MLLSDLNDLDKQFYENLSRTVKLATVEDEPADIERSDLHQQRLDLLAQNAVTYQGVLRAFSDVMTNSQSVYEKLDLVTIMDDLVTSGEETNGSTYPEFLWMVLDSNILFEVNGIGEITTIMRLLYRLGRDMIRSYLIHIVICGTKAQKKNALMALESIKLLKTTLIEFQDDDNKPWFVFVYGDALTFLKREKIIPFLRQDVEYLQAFFAEGMEIEQNHISEICREALSILNNPSSFTNNVEG